MKLLVLVVLLLGSASALAAPAPSPSPAAASSTSTPAPSPSPAPTPEAIPLTEIAPQSQSAIATLKALEPDDSADAPSAAVRKALPDLSDSISQLLVSGGKVTADGTSLDALRELETNWRKVQDNLVERSGTLGERGRALETESAQITPIEDRWKAAYKAAKDANAPTDTLGLANDVLNAVRDARGRIKVRQTSVLELQNRVGDLLQRAQLGLAGVQQATASALKTLTVRESPALWTAQAQPTPDLADRWRTAYRAQLDQLGEFSQRHSELFAIHGAIFLVLAGLLLWLRRGLHSWTEEEPHLKRSAPIFEVPFATALALSFLFKGTMYAGAPTLFRALSGAVVLLPTVIILRRLLDPRLYTVLYSLVVFFAMDQLQVATAAFPATNRWIFTIEMVGAIVVFILLARAQRSVEVTSKLSLGRWMPLLIGLAIAALAAALGASVLGYTRLGALIGAGVLRSGYVAVFLYALLRVIEGLMVIALRVPPISSLRIARQHRDLVQTRVYRFFRSLAVLLWLLVTLDYFHVLDPFVELLQRFLNAPHKVGEMNLRLEQLVSFAFAIWLSINVSRLLRFLLDEEVYERVNLSPGLPYAISTMLNYLVLLVGFLIALSLLGVDLTKVTIVAGAFSVGLGFGLQNIINNFVSGIILLFERPVKVGDVIQIGDAVGEVRRIGIRASIVRVRDGSDLIMPNGNLISNQVINWTYGDRRRAVEIALNLAPGPDPGHVLELLKSVAAGDTQTVDRPPPEAYITGLGATGLGVIVRVWVNHYEDWIQVRSDLALALSAALEKEGIKLI